MLERKLDEEYEKNEKLQADYIRAQDELEDIQNSRLFDLEAEVRELQTKIEIYESQIKKQKEQKEDDGKTYRKDQLRYQEDLYNLQNKIKHL